MLERLMIVCLLFYIFTIDIARSYMVYQNNVLQYSQYALNNVQLQCERKDRLVSEPSNSRVLFVQFSNKKVRGNFYLIPSCHAQST